MYVAASLIAQSWKGSGLFYWRCWHQAGFIKQRKQFPKLNETDGTPLEEKKVIAKFFTPDGSWTWYAVEFDGEDLFFGLVDGFEKEWGYFSLKELQSIRGKLGLPIERD
ncbi:unnamed protein product [marine sediment metagenome]|uniref:DUF2958 domain-containing protein n=1 Tax=marine sediment metagenome TaxID=412755 RepID=X1KBS1_9ZZZZ